MKKAPDRVLFLCPDVEGIKSYGTTVSQTWMD